MTPKNLFNIILKVIGIFFIKDALVFLAQLVPQLLYINNDNKFLEMGGIINLLSTLVAAFVCIGIIYLLIFRTNYIIDKLKLDKGFDKETIPLNLHRSVILSIAIIVIAGLILVNEIPNFINQLHFYFEQRNMSYGNVSMNAVAYVLLSASKIFIALLLIIYQRLIVNFIELRRKS